MRDEPEHRPTEPVGIDALADRVDDAARGVAVSERIRELPVERVERLVDGYVCGRLVAIDEQLRAGAYRRRARADAEFVGVR
ncbi:hypothetical protein GCM10028858_17710 [Halorubrum pallidum]